MSKLFLFLLEFVVEYSTVVDPNVTVGVTATVLDNFLRNWLKNTGFQSGQIVIAEVQVGGIAIFAYTKEIWLVFI